MRSSRLARLAALVVAVSLGTAACGSSAGDDSGDSKSETRTIKDTFNGDVEGVPVHPKRVVVLWRAGGEVADLGVVPVGQLEGELLPDELSAKTYAKVKDVPTVGTFDGVDVEKVIELEPDLIIGMDHGGISIDYESLQEVAPTVIFKIAEPTDVWANYPKVADALGLTTDFEKRDAQFNESLAQIAKDHADTVKDLTVTSIGADGGSFWVDTSKSLTYQRLTTAGFTYNPTYTKNPERYVEEITAENIASLADQDAIFYDTGLDGKPSPGVQDILDLESFKRLPAVKNGRLFPLTAGTIYTYDAVNQQVADIEAALKKIESQG